MKTILNSAILCALLLAPTWAAENKAPASPEPTPAVQYSAYRAAQEFPGHCNARVRVQAAKAATTTKAEPKAESRAEKPVSTLRVVTIDR